MSDIFTAIAVLLATCLRINYEAFADYSLYALVALIQVSWKFN